MGFRLNNQGRLRNPNWNNQAPVGGAVGTMAPNINLSPKPMMDIPTQQAPQSGFTQASQFKTQTQQQPFNAVNFFMEAKNKLRQDQPAPIAPQFEQMLSTIQPSGAQGQGYWNQQRQSIMDNINRQFFGPLGTAQQAASRESAAGRLGSGVGTLALEDAVTRPFYEAITTAERDIGQRMAEDIYQAQQRADEFNKFKLGLIKDVRMGDQEAMARLDDTIKGLLSGQVQMSQQEAQEMLGLLEADLASQKLGAELSAMRFSPTDLMAFPQEYWQQQVQAMGPEGFQNWMGMLEESFPVQQEFWRSMEEQYGSDPTEKLAQAYGPQGNPGKGLPYDPNNPLTWAQTWR